MDYATRVDIGRKKARREGGINEDSVSALVFNESHRDSVRQSAGVFVLADGVGGTSGGDVASYLATTVVPEELSSLALRLVRAENPVFDNLDMDTGGFPTPPSTEEIRQAISDAVGKADEEIHKRRRGQGSATTIVVGVYTRGQLHIGWVGDSPAYVINRSERRIEQLTRDHSAVAYYVSKGEITPTVARVHSDKSTISRAVGGSNADVEFVSVPIFGDDIVLFTSDGLLDAYDRSRELYQEYLRAEDKEAVEEKIREKVVMEDEIRDRVLDAWTLEEAAEGLLELTQKRGGTDNFSVVLFADKSRPAKAATGESDLNRAFDSSTDHDLEGDETVVDE